VVYVILYGGYGLVSAIGRAIRTVDITCGSRHAHKIFVVVVTHSLRLHVNEHGYTLFYLWVFDCVIVLLIIYILRAGWGWGGAYYCKVNSKYQSVNQEQVLVLIRTTYH
jgi:hypothetical protein